MYDKLVYGEDIHGYIRWLSLAKPTIEMTHAGYELLVGRPHR